MNLNKYTAAALKAACAAGDVIEKHFNSPLEIRFKGEIDPVTNVDIKAQETILKILKNAFPGHSFLTEEDSSQKCSSDYCWIIDPMDGTVNFIHRIPYVCVSIALMHKGKIVCGVVHAPMLCETYSAQAGGGAWVNKKRIHVSPERTLVRSLAITGFPYSVHTSAKRHAGVMARVLEKVQGVRRFGSAAIDLAYVASGKSEVFWEEELKPWDVAAGSLILKEAGGKITDFSGGKNFIFGGTMLATNGILHRPMLELLGGNK